MTKKRGLGLPVTLIMALVISGCSSASDILTTPTSTPSDVSATIIPETNSETTSISTPSDVFATITPKTDSGTTPDNPPAGGLVLADNEVLINSYPLGAEVYIVPATVDIYDVDLENIIREDNLIGKTPLTYILSPGTYYVITVFMPDLFTNFGYDLPARSDPTFDNAFPFDGNPSQSMSFTDGEYIKNFTKIYSLIKDSGRSETLISIALPLPKDQRGQQKPALYPTLATVDALPTNYSFDTVIVKKAIEDNLKEYNLASMVGSTMLNEMIEVLLRVGKVKLDTSDIDLIVHMQGTGTNNFSISMYGR